MSELPNNGRNWMNLALLAPGARSNAASEVPQDRQGYFQINVDGQQVTQLLCCSQTQPRYNRDSIAEFELVSNRFDATQGRSAGMIVNAITKSGTNTLQGTVSGAFRDDTLNAADLVAHRVLPYSDQQVGFTMADRSGRTGCTTLPVTSTSASRERRRSTVLIRRSMWISPPRARNTPRPCARTCSCPTVRT
jgi:hypothetical protein